MLRNYILNSALSVVHMFSSIVFKYSIICFDRKAHKQKDFHCISMHVPLINLNVNLLPILLQVFHICIALIFSHEMPICVLPHSPHFIHLLTCKAFATKSMLCTQKLQQRAVKYIINLNCEMCLYNLLVNSSVIEQDCLLNVISAGTGGCLCPLEPLLCSRDRR